MKAVFLLTSDGYMTDQPLRRTTRQSESLQAGGYIHIGETAAATCTQDGHTAYWTCKDCLTIFADKYGKANIIVYSQNGLAKTEKIIIK